ncbi:WD40-repeat-containing domain protein [Pilobolus umbonatus]|nr:WD40-repeat-containing domain protein [Pilobolus umbonatus]
MIEPLFELKGHKQAVISIDFTWYSGRPIVATGSEDCSCRLWDLEQKKVMKGIKGLADPVTSVRFASKQPYLYLSSGTKVFIYDISKEDMIITEPIQTFEFSKDEINSIDLNDANTLLATADDAGAVHIIDLVNKKVYKKTTKKHKNICMAVKFRPNKAWEVWSGGMDSKVNKWDITRGSIADTYDMNSKEPSAAQMFNPPFVYSMDTSPGGDWIAAGLGDSTIQLLCPPGKKASKDHKEEIRLENGHNGMVNCVSFVKTDSLQLISGGVNGKIARWIIDDQSQEPYAIYQLDKSIEKLNCLKAYEANGSIKLIVGGVGGVVNVYAI